MTLLAAQITTAFKENTLKVKINRSNEKQNRFQTSMCRSARVGTGCLLSLCSVDVYQPQSMPVVWNSSGSITAGTLNRNDDIRIHFFPWPFIFL